MSEAPADTLPTRIRLTLPQVALAPLPAQLPDDPAALKALLAAQHEAHRQAIEQAITSIHEQALGRIQFLYEQFVLYRRKMFGPSSEALPAQSRLFDEAEILAGIPDEDTAADATEEASTPTTDAPSAPGKPKARGKRVPLPAELPRVDVIHDIPEGERVCGCGKPMVLIGEEVSEQLDIVPMKIQVLRHIQRRYGCPDGDTAPVTADKPAQPLPKSNASPDLLAMLLTVKYADGLPLARFEKVLVRHGVQVPRQTLARWVIGGANALQPLWNLAQDRLTDHDLMHMDETPVQVLKEPGRSATAKSYMWVRIGGPPDKPVVLYDYDPSRSAEVPRRLLAGFQGWLMTDGYGAYGKAVQTEDIEQLACWAHVRRKFIDAQKIQGKGKTGRADQALAMIRELYKVERDAQALSNADRLKLRTERSVPVLGKLQAWMQATISAVPPSTVLGNAIRYMAGLWPQLERYVTRGDLPIDNNPVENAIRPFVVGRKAWLFSATPAGAHASALIYSLVETAKANRLEPSAWLAMLLRTVPGAQSVEAIEALLPWNLHPATLPRILKT